MHSVALRIDQSGGLLTMYDEGFDVGFLGPRSIERVTEIPFDEGTQTFYVRHMRTGEVLASGFQTYSEAVQYEKNWFCLRIADNVNPLLQT